MSQEQITMIETRASCLSTEKVDIRFRYKKENIYPFSFMINKGDWRTFENSEESHRFLDGVHETLKALGLQ